MASLLLLCSMANTVHAQKFLKKLKEKAVQTAESVVDKKIDNATGNNSTGTNNSSSSSGSGSSPSSSSGRPMNNTGAGITNSSVPDVAAQITEAETLHGKSQYSDARYSLQQAMMGIEIQLGRQIVRSLPQQVNALPADTTQDKVMSTQYGWSNLSMQRVYRQGEQQLTITIGNNSAYAGVLQLYFSNAAMIEASNDQQNIKQVRVKGAKALIQFDQRKGYTLMMQMGQTSMVVWECINFASEQDVMNAASQFDIDAIKKLLGEQ